MKTDLTKSITPWPLKVKLKRKLWEIVSALLFKPSPKRMGAQWRVFLLRSFGAKIGEQCFIMSSVKILQPWMLELGDGSVIGADADIYNFARIKIGKMSMVSQRTFLCTGSHDHADPHLPLVFEPITIGDEVWVASECFVGPGRTIGSGTVVAARSVVVRDLPEWMICAGHPCKPLKPRVMNSEPKIQQVAKEFGGP